MNSNKNRVGLTIVGIILIIASVILFVFFFLRGQTTITGQNGEIITRESLTCEAKNPEYQFLSYDNTDNKIAKIIVLFDNHKFDSISFMYTLYYNDTESIRTSKTINSAQLNVFYGKDGLPANSFTKTFSSDDEKVTMSLYANADDFNSVTSKYFMADGLDDKSNLDIFVKKFNEQGFDCKD